MPVCRPRAGSLGHTCIRHSLRLADIVASTTTYRHGDPPPLPTRRSPCPADLCAQAGPGDAAAAAGTLLLEDCAASLAVVCQELLEVVHQLTADAHGRLPILRGRVAAAAAVSCSSCSRPADSVGFIVMCVCACVCCVVVGVEVVVSRRTGWLLSRVILPFFPTQILSLAARGHPATSFAEALATEHGGSSALDAILRVIAHWRTNDTRRPGDAVGR
jgi:hypothetical protein